MSDEFDKLRSAMSRATPAPDPEKRAADIMLAMKNFDRIQESADPLRPMSDRPQRAGFMTGVRNMLTTLTSRPALAATTSIVALGVGLYMVLPLQPQLSGQKVPAPAEITRAEKRERTQTLEVQQAPQVAQAPQASLDDSAARMVEQGLAANSADAPIAKATNETIALAAPPEPASPPSVQSLGSDALGESMAVESEEVSGYARMSDAIAPSPELPVIVPENTEAFANEAPNPVKITAEEPVSTFSVDVDTAAWAVVRSSLSAGYLPPADAVRIEELVNYFPYDYAAPDASEAPFRASVVTMQTPWNTSTRLVRIALQGQMPAVEDRPPLNLVFLIDTSGSMQDADKLPLLKQSFRLMLSELRPEDQVSIVTYAGSAGQVLAPTPASERQTILAALDRLEAGGSTAGQAGLQQAYAVAEAMAGPGEVSRVLLATDGDFNVGLSDPEALKDYIAGKRDTGVYLSVLGFGRGNLDDATMQSLAQNGNGQAAYIDTLNEARKVLVDQLSGALFPIAGDVKIQVEWNPAEVAEYRLIGYETRVLAREDFNNDKVDAGDIGAGHAVTALYEVTAPGSEALRNDPLRYAAPAAGAPTGELGFLRLRYKTPGEDTSNLIETPILPAGDGAEVDGDARFAAAIAGFGQLLRDPKYLGDWGYDEAIALANGARGEDAFGYRSEAVNMMRLAQVLAAAANR